MLRAAGALPGSPGLLIRSFRSGGRGVLERGSLANACQHYSPIAFALPGRPIAFSSGARFAASTAAERGQEWVSAPRINYLPEWAKAEVRPPAYLRFLGAAILVPLGIGAVSVHVLAGNAANLEDSDAEREGQAEYARTALSWSLHYAGVLAAFAGAMHWGMGLAELGTPPKSEAMRLYYMGRFSVPPMYVLFGWLASMLSVANSYEACGWILVGFTFLMTNDAFMKAFTLTPPWWMRWRSGFIGCAALCVLLLMLSERNDYLGQKPKMRI
mmetsp:Transcript_36465/g.79807  ORF Transcript_36465/g.79807 Transcript_36465/m.79807 type:complete len:271 (-) Transcript_36465:101-913(-)